MTKNKKISIFIDAHLSFAADSFRELGFRVIETSKNNKFRGIDERDYLSDIISENGVFVTSDESFVREIFEKNTYHTGIVYIPKNMLKDEKSFFCSLVGGYIQGMTSINRSNIKNLIIYPGHDGLHRMKNNKDILDTSWDWFSEQINK